MAVPTWKQTASKLDAFAEAVKLRHIITQMIMRNFGLKRTKYDAIGDIARIRQEVLFIEEFFNIDLSRYMEYSEQLELTKNYLYRWKKSTVRDYDEFLHPEKKASYLVECPERIRRMYADIGIELNEKKTRIVKLSDEFKFLKAKTHLTGTGRVVMRPDRGTITRERRKLKALRRKLDAGEIVFADVQQAYNSWRGHIKHFDSYRTMRNMDKLFHELFSEEIRKERSGRNGSKKSKNYRGEFKQYDFPERIDPAERRHRIKRGSERDDIRKRGSGS